MIQNPRDFDNLIAPMRAHANAAPDHPALSLRSGETMYHRSRRQIMAGAEAWAKKLIQIDVKPGAVIFIFLDHHPQQYEAFLGAVIMGAIPSFMPPLTAKQKPEIYWPHHRNLIERTKPGAIILDGARATGLAANLDLAGIILITPDQIDQIGEGEVVAEIPVTRTVDDLAFLQHSSGTTRTKKGVGLSHRAVLRQIAAYGERLEISSQDKIASWLPLYHDMGLIACFIMPMVLGIPIVALDPFEWTMQPSLLLAAIEAHTCTLVWMPNFAFHHLARTRPADQSFDLKSVRAWIDCSEPCRPASFDLFARIFGGDGVDQTRLQVCYAMAETVFAVSQTPLGVAPHRLKIDSAILRADGRIAPPAPGNGALELLSNGTALPGIEIRIVDAHRQAVPEGHVGEIAISGEFLFDGYWNLRAETAEKLDQGWYYTHDQGFLHHGELYVLGRIDDLLILNGRNFYAHDLEATLSDIDGLKPGRILATSRWESDLGTDVCVILAEVDGPDAPTARALQSQIMRRIYDQTQMMPREVLLIPPGTLLKSTSGKLNRAANRERLLTAKDTSK
jgi:acyl-CoA synthetase (AMP-forming)/AMP-acid ligase II